MPSENSTKSASRTPAPAAQDQGVRGAQSVRRALALLRLVAQHADDGAKLAQLVQKSGLDRGTAYRLLTCLSEEGFVERDSAQFYRLGVQAVTLGSLLPEPTPLMTHFGPAMKRIARIAGDTVFLFVRHGDYMQCELREVGGTLIKILITHVGERRLIGTGVAGVAVLGLMRDEELSQVWHRRSAEYTARRIPLERLRAMAHAVRVQGHVINFDAVEPGVAGIGMAFRMGEHAMGALSMGTLTAQFGPERQHQFRELLAAELRTLNLLGESQKKRTGQAT